MIFHVCVYCIVLILRWPPLQESFQNKLHRRPYPRQFPPLPQQTGDKVIGQCVLLYYLCSPSLSYFSTVWCCVDMVCVCGVCGVCMVCVYGVCAWCVCMVCVVCVWCVCMVCVVCVWCVWCVCGHGVCGVCIVCVWCVHSVCVVCVWCVSSAV